MCAAGIIRTCAHLRSTGNLSQPFGQAPYCQPWMHRIMAFHIRACDALAGNLFNGLVRKSGPVA